MTSMIPILIDLSLVVLLLICMLIGHFRGFIKSFLGAISVILSLVIAVSLAAPVGSFLDRSFLREKVENTVREVITERLETVPEDSSEVTSDDRFGAISALVGKFGLDQETIAELSNTDIRERFIEKAASAVVDKLVPMLSVVLAFILIFILSLVILLILKTVLGLAAKLPVLKKLDKTLGTLWGLLYGVLLVFLLSGVFVKIAPYLLGMNEEYFINEILNRTVLLKFVDKINLVGILLNWVLPKTI